MPVAAWPSRSLPGQQRRDGLALDRRRLLVAQAGQCLQQLGTERQTGEACRVREQVLAHYLCSGSVGAPVTTVTGINEDKDTGPAFGVSRPGP